MAMIPHLCSRHDCKHNHPFDHCGFFSGDIYYLDCIENATMYQKRDKEE